MISSNSLVFSIRAISLWLSWTWVLRLQGWTQRWGLLWGWPSPTDTRSTASTMAFKDWPEERWAHLPWRLYHTAVRFLAINNLYETEGTVPLLTTHLVCRFLRLSGTAWQDGRAKGAPCWGQNGNQQDSDNHHVNLFKVKINVYFLVKSYFVSKPKLRSGWCHSLWLVKIIELFQSV